MKDSTMIRLSEKIVDEIEIHAEQTYPEECCGMMLGYSDTNIHVVESVIPIDNSQGDNRKRRFLITPEQYRHAEQLADKGNRELLGFYHSHPDHPAAPSAFDTDHALPWFSYIIVSVEKGKAAAMTAWLLNEERTQFAERMIMVGPSSTAPFVRSAVLVDHRE